MGLLVDVAGVVPNSPSFSDVMRPRWILSSSTSAAVLGFSAAAAFMLSRSVRAVDARLAFVKPVLIGVGWFERVRR